MKNYNYLSAMIITCIATMQGCKDDNYYSLDSDELPTSTSIRVKALNGSIENATVTDFEGNIARNLGKGEYEFLVEPVYPISLDGGQFLDNKMENTSFKRRSFEPVISPINNFVSLLGEEEMNESDMLLSNLSNFTSISIDDLIGDSDELSVKKLSLFLSVSKMVHTELYDYIYNTIKSNDVSSSDFYGLVSDKIKNKTDFEDLLITKMLQDFSLVNTESDFKRYANRYRYIVKNLSSIRSEYNNLYSVNVDAFNAYNLLESYIVRVLPKSDKNTDINVFSFSELASFVENDEIVFYMIQSLPRTKFTELTNNVIDESDRDINDVYIPISELISSVAYSYETAFNKETNLLIADYAQEAVKNILSADLENEDLALSYLRSLSSSDFSSWSVDFLNLQLELYLDKMKTIYEVSYTPSLDLYEEFNEKYNPEGIDKETVIGSFSQNISEQEGVLEFRLNGLDKNKFSVVYDENKNTYDLISLESFDFEKQESYELRGAVYLDNNLMSSFPTINIPITDVNDFDIVSISFDVENDYLILKFNTSVKLDDMRLTDFSLSSSEVSIVNLVQDEENSEAIKLYLDNSEEIIFDNNSNATIISFTNEKLLGNDVTITHPVSAVRYLNMDYGFIYSENTNRLWLDRNIGAENSCLINASLCSGYYLQWGRRVGDLHGKFPSPTTNTQIALDDYDSSSNEFVLGSKWYETNSESATVFARALSPNSGLICPKGFEMMKRSDLDNESSHFANAEDALKMLGMQSNHQYRRHDSDALSTGATHYWLNDTTYGYVVDIGTNQSKLSYKTFDTAWGMQVRCIKAE